MESNLHNVIPIGLLRWGDLVARTPTFFPPNVGGAIFVGAALEFDFEFELRVVDVVVVLLVFK